MNGGLKWAALTVGVVIVICGAVFARGETVANRAAEMEVTLGRQDERLKGIESDVRWIRRKLENGG